MTKYEIKLASQSNNNNASDNRQNANDNTNKKSNKDKNKQPGFSYETSQKIQGYSESSPEMKFVVVNKDNKVISTSDNITLSEATDVIANSSKNSLSNSTDRTTSNIDSNNTTQTASDTSTASTFVNSFTNFISNAFPTSLFSSKPSSIENTNSNVNDSSTSQAKPTDSRHERKPSSILKNSFKSSPPERAKSIISETSNKRAVTFNHQRQDSGMTIKSNRSGESRYNRSVNELWENHRLEDTKILKTESVICKDSVHAIIKTVLDAETGISTLRSALSERRSNLLYGVRKNMMEPKTPGIRDTEWKKLSDHEQEILRTGFDEITEMETKLKAKQDDLDGKYSRLRDDNPEIIKLKKEIEDDKNLLNDFTQLYKSYSDKYNENIQKELRANSEIKELEKKCKQAIETMIIEASNTIESIDKANTTEENNQTPKDNKAASEETEANRSYIDKKVDNQILKDNKAASEEMEANQSYIDKKAEKLLQAVMGGKLTGAESKYTALSTRPRELNVGLTETHNTHNVRNYHIMDHLSLVTAYVRAKKELTDSYIKYTQGVEGYQNMHQPEKNKYKYTLDQQERILNAIKMNAQSLRSAMDTMSVSTTESSNSTKKILDDQEFSEEPKEEM